MVLNEPGPDGRPAPHPLVAAACEALESAGVRWVVLRGERELADPRGDVDILVDGHRDVREVRRALRPLGIVAVPGLGAGAHRHFWGYHRPTDRWIEFDVEWDLDFGPQRHFALNWLAPALRSGAARAVLARRRRSPDVPGVQVLHPDDGFWALLLHVLVDKAAVPGHHADRLLELCAHATASSPLATMVTATCPPGWDAERVIRSVRAGDWPALLELGRVLGARAYARRPVSHRAHALVRGLRRLGLALGPALVSRGITVEIVGPDGAGRSALSAGLVSGQPLGARLVPSEARPDRTAPAWRAVVGAAGRSLRDGRRRLVVNYHRLRGRMVVLDQPAADRPTARSGPRPDLVIVVDPPGSPAAGRRPEEVLADAMEVVWAARTGHRQGPSNGSSPVPSPRVSPEARSARRSPPRRTCSSDHGDDARDERRGDQELRHQVGHADPHEPELAHQPPGRAE